MNKSRSIYKPVLLDPILEKKIIKTLNRQKETYWEPTKLSLKTIYTHYIKPNIKLIIFIIIIFFLFFYRYITVKRNREKKKFEQLLNISNEQQQSSNEHDLLKLILKYYDQKHDKLSEPNKKLSHLHSSKNKKK